MPIDRMRVAADVPVAERTSLEVLRTDTQTFASVRRGKADRSEEWFKYRVSRTDVCNVPVPVR